MDKNCYAQKVTQNARGISLLFCSFALIILFCTITTTSGTHATPANDPSGANNNNADDITGDKQQSSSHVVRGFQMPKLFDFTRFKRLFKKTYGHLEELARKRLFLGRAFRVFLSAIAYKYRRSSFYLAINHMSDWTLDEISRLYPKRSLKDANQINPPPKQLLVKLEPEDEQRATYLPVASLPEIRQKLEQLVETTNPNEHQPTRSKLGAIIASELKSRAVDDDHDHIPDQIPVEGREKREVVVQKKQLFPKEESFKQVGQKRPKTKRSTKQVRQEFNLNQLIPEPKLLRLAENREKSDQKRGAQVASNNKNYQQLELTSQAAPASVENQKLPAELASVITRIPGYNYLNSLIQSVQSAWYSSDEDDVSPPKGEQQQDDEEEENFEDASSDELDEKLDSNSLITNDDDADELSLLSAPVVAFAGAKDGADVVWLDYRAKTPECYMSVRSQGSCGSCYAFATIALYEWHYCTLNGGQKVALSEQYLIDCGQAVKLHGCDGGLFTRVSTFINLFGLELRANYPYRQHQDQCPYTDLVSGSSENGLQRGKFPENLKKLGYLRMQDDGFHPVHYSQFAAYLRHSPMLLNIKISDRFVEYGGGVDDPSDYCESDRIHSVLLIGHGRQDGLDYWLVRNSHSVSWGEWGHYKLSKRATACLDNDHAYYLANVRMEQEQPSSSVSAQVSEQVKDRYKEYLLRSVSEAEQPEEEDEEDDDEEENYEDAESGDV